MTWRNVHGASDKGRSVAISGEIARAQNACGNTGPEEFAIPGRMILAGDHPRIRTVKNGCDAVLYCLKRLPIAARRERVTMSSVTGGLVWSPLSRADAFNQIRADLIAFDRERVISVRNIDVFDLLQTRAGIDGHRPWRWKHIEN